MTDELFSNLSAFYVTLWRHLDAFFDDNRWLRSEPVQDFSDREKTLKRKYATLSDGLLGREPTLAAQIKRDLEAVQDLTQKYWEQKPARGDHWYKRAEQMRSYLQEMGIHYAELASTRA